MVKYFESANTLMEKFVKVVEENEMSYKEAREEAKKEVNEMYNALFFYEEEKNWDEYASKESYEVNYKVYEEFKTSVEEYCENMFFESAC